VNSAVEASAFGGWSSESDVGLRRSLLLRHLVIVAKTFLLAVLPRSAFGIPTKRQLHKMSFTNPSNGEEVGRDPHSNYHRRSLCPDAAPRLSLIQLWNMTYHHKHYVTRRTRLHRKESSNMNLGIQILSNGTRTTESALGIGQRCTNAGSRSSWECSPSRPV
jgi:hypothetical protein